MFFFDLVVLCLLPRVFTALAGIFGLHFWFLWRDYTQVWSRALPWPVFGCIQLHLIAFSISPLVHVTLLHLPPACFALGPLNLFSPSFLSRSLTTLCTRTLRCTLTCYASLPLLCILPVLHVFLVFTTQCARSFLCVIFCRHSIFVVSPCSNHFVLSLSSSIRLSSTGFRRVFIVSCDHFPIYQFSGDLFGIQFSSVQPHILNLINLDTVVG